MIALGFALLAIVGLIFLLRASDDFPVGSPGKVKIISVTDGESGTAIALDLEHASVIKSAKKLIKEMALNKASLGIAPGLHRLDSHIPSTLALSQLLDQKRLMDVVKVIPGSTTADVLTLLRNDHKLVEKNTFSGLRSPLSAPNNSLEGQLFPSNYSFAPGSSTHDALQKMLDNFSHVCHTTGLLRGIPGYTPYQLLIIASLIQIEADPQDYEKAAAVMYNRLKIGMPLQLNSTVQYALDKRGTIALSVKATTFESPYNTYVHTGLPPTPISNPGIAAIQAALHPATGDWLYFITVSPHDTRFTHSFKEFDSWVTLYNHNLSSGAFR
jgi:UPF0755 protein